MDYSISILSEILLNYYIPWNKENNNNNNNNNKNKDDDHQQQQQRTVKKRTNSNQINNRKNHNNIIVVSIMGNTISDNNVGNGGGVVVDDDGQHHHQQQHQAAIDEFDGIETLGYRVLGVQPNSPASQAGLVSFFDFLLGANGQMLLGSGEGLEEGDEYDDIDFPALLLANKGQTIELLVWNIKSQEQRLVELIPNDDWGGAGLLGVTIRLDDYGGADERLIRVLHVEHQSPASIAGLVPSQDFLLGTSITSFNTTELLSTVLQHHLDQVIEIYVYNIESDVVRVIALMPTYTWGGHGCLGAEVGTGYLHRLPSSCRTTIGQSVERKVRWISTNNNNNNTENTTENNNTNNNENTSSTITSEGTTNIISGGTLETEPHLEMEQDHTDSEQRPEHATRQPHELGSTEEQLKPIVQQQQQPPPQQQQQQPPQQQPPQQQQQQQPPPQQQQQQPEMQRQQQQQQPEMQQQQQQQQQLDPQQQPMPTANEPQQQPPSQPAMQQQQQQDMVQQSQLEVEMATATTTTLNGGHNGTPLSTVIENESSQSVSSTTGEDELNEVVGVGGGVLPQAPRSGELLLQATPEDAAALFAGPPPQQEQQTNDAATTTDEGTSTTTTTTTTTTTINNVVPAPTTPNTASNLAKFQMPPPPQMSIK